MKKNITFYKNSKPEVLDFDKNHIVLANHNGISVFNKGYTKSTNYTIEYPELRESITYNINNNMVNMIYHQKVEKYDKWSGISSYGVHSVFNMHTKKYGHIKILGNFNTSELLLRNNISIAKTKIKGSDEVGYFFTEATENCNFVLHSVFRKSGQFISSDNNPNIESFYFGEYSGIHQFNNKKFNNKNLENIIDFNSKYIYFKYKNNIAQIPYRFNKNIGSENMDKYGAGINVEEKNATIIPFNKHLESITEIDNKTLYNGFKFDQECFIITFQHTFDNKIKQVIMKNDYIIEGKCGNFYYTQIDEYNKAIKIIDINNYSVIHTFADDIKNITFRNDAALYIDQDQKLHKVSIAKSGKITDEVCKSQNVIIKYNKPKKDQDNDEKLKLWYESEQYNLKKQYEESLKQLENHYYKSLDELKLNELDKENQILVSIGNQYQEFMENDFCLLGQESFNEYSLLS